MHTLQNGSTDFESSTTSVELQKRNNFPHRLLLRAVLATCILACGGVKSHATSNDTPASSLKDPKATVEKPSMTAEDLDRLIENALKDFADEANKHSILLEYPHPLALNGEDRLEGDGTLQVFSYFINNFDYINAEKVLFSLIGEAKNPHSEFTMMELIHLIQLRFKQYGIFVNFGRPVHGGKLFYRCEEETIDPNDYPGITEIFHPDAIKLVATREEEQMATLNRLHEASFGIPRPHTSQGIAVLHMSDQSIGLGGFAFGSSVYINDARKQVYYDEILKPAIRNHPYLKDYTYEDGISSTTAHELNHRCVHTLLGQGIDTIQWDTFDSGFSGTIENNMHAVEFLGTTSELLQDKRSGISVINMALGNLDQEKDGIRCHSGSYKFTYEFSLSVLEEIFRRKGLESMFFELIEQYKEYIKSVTPEEGSEEYEHQTRIITKLNAQLNKLHELEASNSATLNATVKSLNAHLDTLPRNSLELREALSEAQDRIDEIKTAYKWRRYLITSEIYDLNQAFEACLTSGNSELLGKLLAQLDEDDFEFMQSEYMRLGFTRPDSEGGSIFRFMQHQIQNADTTSSESQANGQ